MSLFDDIEAAARKHSQFGFLRRRIDDIAEETEEPPQKNIGTWAPSTPGAQLGPTHFTFQQRQAGLRKPDYSDPSLVEGFDGPDVDKENYIGHQLIRRYKEDPTPDKMEHLMAHYDQLIGTAIGRFSRQRLPEPAVRGKVYNTFHDAVNRYDFRPGEEGNQMQFHNYFMSYPMKEMKRWADQRRGFAHVPAARAAKHDEVRLAVEQFQIEHQRDPTLAEIQSQTRGIPLNELRRIVPELQGTGLGSRNIRSDSVVDETELWRRTVRRTWESLPPNSLERRVYEDFFGEAIGLGGPGNLTKDQLARKHGISGSKRAKLFKKFRILHSQEMQNAQRDM